LINWIILNRPQHSYLLGWERTCPVRKSFYKSNSIRTPWSNSDTGASVKPVRRTSLTSVACRTSYKSRDRSYRCWWPVRPVCPAWSARCQFWVSTESLQSRAEPTRKPSDDSRMSVSRAGLQQSRVKHVTRVRPMANWAHYAWRHTWVRVRLGRT
jgi:hypothetical protein